MRYPTSFEVVIPVQQAQQVECDRLKTLIEQALGDAGLGEVTFAGCFGRTINLDVEAIDLDRGLACLRRVLYQLKAPAGTLIHSGRPVPQAYALDGRELVREALRFMD